MHYNEIKNAIQVFDDFVTKALSAQMDKINPIEVVKAYNQLKTFINQHVELEDEPQDSK